MHRCLFLRILTCTRMFFQSRLISLGHFFRLDFDILTENSSPLCPIRSKISNIIYSFIYQSNDTLLTWFPVCGNIQFILVKFFITARANNVYPRSPVCQFGRFPGLSKSSLLSNREMHLLMYLVVHWKRIYISLIMFSIVIF